MNNCKGRKTGQSFTSGPSAILGGLLMAVVTLALLSTTAQASWMGRSLNFAPGPFPWKNQQPIQLLFLQPPVDRAIPIPWGTYEIRLDIAMSNVIHEETAGDIDVVIDMEFIRSSYTLVYGAGNGLELGMELPFYYTWRGFMDDIILDLEMIAGVERGLRVERPGFQFDYRLSRGGQTFLSGREDVFGLGDLSIWLKRLLVKEGGFPAVNVRGAVKIPTGDKDGAFGSGEWDASAGILLEKKWGRSVYYLNADLIFPGDPFKDAGIEAEPYLVLVWCWEFRVAENFAFNLQVDFLDRPFRHLNIDLLDNRILDVLLGVTYTTKKGNVVRFGLVEDIFASEEEAADISLFLSLTRRH